MGSGSSSWKGRRAAGENLRSRQRTETGGVAGCGRDPVCTARSLPLPHPILGPLSTGGSVAERFNMENTGWGRWGRSSRTGGQTEGQCRGEGVAKAGGAFQQRAGHCWAVAAVPKAATAEAAEATRNKHANDTQATQTSQRAGPQLSVSQYQGQCPERQGRAGEGVTLAGQSPPSLASAPPSRRTGSETDYGV